MKIMKYCAAFALATSLMGTTAAIAAPKPAKQFKNAMQTASAARLNRNGSNILRFEVDQDLTLRRSALVNSSMRVNALTVDDSLLTELDIDQNATLRNTRFTNSSATLNTVDMTRARSHRADIDQDVTMRNVATLNAHMVANTISIR